jgi:RHS repeat-associated protein
MGVYDTQDRLLSYSSTQLLNGSSIKYFYTQNGDLTMKVDTVTSDTTRYSYDGFGALRSVRLPDGTIIEYLIDGSGRRVGRKVNGSVTQKWLYSSDLRIIAELDSVNNITSRFVYTTSENVPEYFAKSDTIYRIITDQVGSVRFVIKISTGEVIQRMEYDEYGQVLFDSNPGFQPFGFAGGLYDLHTKLVRFGARDYEAKSGRWTCKDPLLFKSEESDLYAYCSNNPINIIDPRGKVGFGIVVSAGVEGGLGYGGGAQIDIGYGIFVGGEKGINAGGFVSGGFYENHGDPYNPQGGGVLGAYAGCGAGFFLTSAESSSELAGWFDTYSINTPWIGIQYSRGYTEKGKFVVLAQFTFSPPWASIGISISDYPTYTVAF